MMRKWKFDIHDSDPFYVEYHLRDRSNTSNYIFTVDYNFILLDSDMLLLKASPNYKHCCINLGFEI